MISTMQFLLKIPGGNSCYSQKWYFWSFDSKTVMKIANRKVDTQTTQSSLLYKTFVIYRSTTWRGCCVWNVGGDGGRTDALDDDVVLARRELLADQVDGLRVRQVIVVHLVVEVGRHFGQVTHDGEWSGMCNLADLRWRRLKYLKNFSRYFCDFLKD